MADPEAPLNEEEMDEFGAELLDLLREEEPETPATLPGEAIQRVHATITTRDMIDLTTVVFLLKFCAPLIDMIGALIGGGVSPTPAPRGENDE